MELVNPLLQEALARLAVDYPRGYIVLLAHIGGESTTAIAKNVGITRNSVSHRLTCAKTLMRKYIKEASETNEFE